MGALSQENEVIPVQNTGVVRITENALSEMMTERSQLKSFIKSQLIEGVDFGLLPSVKTYSLFKAGAEKIASLFQLGSRIVKSEKTIEIKDNFAMFAVTIEIFHLPSGKAIAQCEGITNSQEKKWKEKKDYKTGKIEATPVGDILNTLNKMAQKRAFVGGIIVATRASDFFTPDMNEEEEEFAEQNPNYFEKVNAAQVAGLEKARQAQAEKAKQMASKPSEGTFGDFAGGGFKMPSKEESQELDKKKFLGKINQERVRLQWTTEKMGSFIQQNFEKTGAKLNNDELQILITTLERQK
jgi:hypothetical protein